MTASKSFVNICTALTLSRFLAETVLRDCPEGDSGARKIRRMADRIVSSVMATRKLWPDCDRDGVLKVEQNVARMGAHILHGERSMEELCGVTLALLVDMELCLKGARKEAIGELCRLMESLNREFDRRGENHAAYEYAAEAVDRWYASLGV